MTKILFVDDEKDIVETIRGGLTKRGYEVEVYNDPKKALVNFVPNTYDLILLDVKMPEMSGFELYDEIKKKDARAKIRFLTAFEFRPDEPKKILSDLTGNDFIYKPITISKLVEMITDLLKLSV